ncbi:MAG: hypothetical protein IJ088_13535 [Clostridia bacterium]|nr:hypothetical protein [Clostridia bacterium]
MMLKRFTFFLILAGMMVFPAFGGLANTGITLGSGKISKDSKVWFGDQILWRVLKNENGAALLISDTSLDMVVYNDDSDNVEWEGSLAQNWCFIFYLNWPDGVEKDAILPTTCTEKDDRRENGIAYTYKGGHEGKYYYSSASLDEEFFFLLSGKEADELFENDRERRSAGSKTWWWLRSPSERRYRNNRSTVAGIVDDDGWVSDTSVTSLNGIRPAFNLDLSAILYTSEIREDSSVSYLLTMMDRNLNVEVQQGKKAYRDGKIITVPYTVSGSNADESTRVYALVTDKRRGSESEVIQYTELSAESGTGIGSFPLDSNINGIWGKDFHIYLLAVNKNDGSRTTFASMPRELRP